MIVLYLPTVVVIGFPGRQRYRVRDDKRRNEDRGGGITDNRNGSGGYNARSGGSTGWSDNPGGEKGYLGGLGKYGHKKDAVSAVAAANSVVEQNAGYASSAPYAYNPQTNSITPAYMQPPTSAAYGQQFPYQNGTGGGYPAYQQPAMQYGSGTASQALLPPPQAQQVYYSAPPPPPPPPPGQ